MNRSARGRAAQILRFDSIVPVLPLVCAALVGCLDRSPPTREVSDTLELAVGEMKKAANGDMLLNIPGTSRPLLQPAAEVLLGDAAPVIGVQVAEHYRCYLLKALRLPTITDYGQVRVHVVNDLIDGVALSVTYCDVNDCARVFTQPSDRRRPLNLSIGGWSVERGMLLLWGGKRYRQQSDQIPLQDLEFTRTTWKAWRTLHPDTLVYTGETRSAIP